MGKRCGNCAHGTWLKGMDAVPEVCLNCGYAHGEPSNWAEKTMTNADRIRAMSDEDLCEFLGQYSFFEMCDEGCDACTYKGNCDERLLKWLKQPADQDEEEDKRLQRSGRWIPVTERLPEKITNKVIVLCKNGYRGFGHYEDYKGKQTWYNLESGKPFTDWDLEDCESYEVTHWMPLPQPPKGE